MSKIKELGYLTQEEGVRKVKEIKRRELEEKIRPFKEKFTKDAFFLNRAKMRKALVIDNEKINYLEGEFLIDIEYGVHIIKSISYFKGAMILENFYGRKDAINFYKVKDISFIKIDEKHVEYDIVGFLCNYLYLRDGNFQRNVTDYVGKAHTLRNKIQIDKTDVFV